MQLAHFYQREASVEGYTEKFQVLEAKATLQEENMLEFYIENLWDKIRAEVKMFKPTTIKDAMFYARQVEEK